MRASQEDSVLPMAPVVEQSLLDEDSKLFHAFQAVMRDEVPVVIDSGASYSLTPFIEDFVDPLQPANIDLQGLSSKANVKGEGTVEWSIRDVFGVTRTVRTKAYFVPSATIRLFSL